MSDRIDHTAEARRVIADGQTAVSKAAAAYHAGDDEAADAHGKKAHGCWMQAQAEATLALVEQQRIANLIALTDHAHRRWGNFAGEAGGLGVLFSYGETPESNMRIREDVREVLGLS